MPDICSALLRVFLMFVLTHSWALAEPSNSPADGAAPVFELVRENPTANGERRQLMRFTADGLRQYALVLWPAGEPPATGWPALLFNHGYHPDPPNYGRNARGENDRPGDYYRAVAQAFVDRGMVVVAPDFRGHNDSQGQEFTGREDASSYYGRDAVAAFQAMSQLPDLDEARRYMFGHSMGGLVTLAALNELGNRVAAASIWSSMALPADEGFASEACVPLLLQHARFDEVTSAAGSEQIANYLRELGTEIALEIHKSPDHLFTGADFARAVELDLAWFARWVPPARPRRCDDR